MERYYDGDQEALFKAAHVINPYVKPKRESKVMTDVEMSTTFTHLDTDSFDYLARGSFSLTFNDLPEKLFLCHVILTPFSSYILYF